MIQFLFSLPFLVGTFFLEAVFFMNNDVMLVLFYIGWLVIGGGFFMFGGISISTQAIFNTKYVANELELLSLTYAQGNKLFDKFLSSQGNNYNNILGVEDWNRFIVKELYNAVKDKSKSQERLSFYAERVSAAVFEDRIAAHSKKEKEREGTFRREKNKDDYILTI
jgi:hypothetical protein